jgi:hypothetical protein
MLSNLIYLFSLINHYQNSDEFQNCYFRFYALFFILIRLEINLALIGPCLLHIWYLTSISAVIAEKQQFKGFWNKNRECLNMDVTKDWFIRNRTKLSSVLLLCMISFFMNQPLSFRKIYATWMPRRHLFYEKSTTRKWLLSSYHHASFFALSSLFP